MHETRLGLHEIVSLYRVLFMHPLMLPAVSPC